MQRADPLTTRTSASLHSSFPKVLVVHIKRFSHRTFSRSKLNTEIAFPSKLDLSEFVGATARSPSTPPVYGLYAISNHMGGTGGGHYTAHCNVSSGRVRGEGGRGREEEGFAGGLGCAHTGTRGHLHMLYFNMTLPLQDPSCWHTFNDSNVSGVSTDRLGGSSSYVLFFKRIPP